MRGLGCGVDGRLIALVVVVVTVGAMVGAIKPAPVLAAAAERPGAPPQTAAAVSAPPAVPTETAVPALAGAPAVLASEATGPAPTISLNAAPSATTAAPEPRIFEKWWFWTALAAVAVTTVVIVAASSGPNTPKSDLGTMSVF